MNKPRPLQMIRLKDFLALTKFWIALLSTLSAATGYLVFVHAVRWGLLTSSLGVLLLALGACALNEWQERALDARMERTRRRPLPSGALGPGAALAVSWGLVAGGALLLYSAHDLTVALLGLFAILWYNGIYTHLKKVTAFAVVPGAIIGALPPAIGWAAGGGGILDPQVLALAFFFFIWQVPHFWLLLFKYGGDYEKAGLPTLTGLFSPRQLSRLTFIWILVTGATSLLLPIFGLITSPPGRFGLLLAGLWIVWIAARVLRGRGNPASFRSAFQGINMYALLVMVLLVLDGMVLGR